MMYFASFPPWSSTTHTTGDGCPERPRGAKLPTVQNTRELTTTSSCRGNAHASLLLVHNNRTGSRISSETSPLKANPGKHDHVRRGRRGSATCVADAVPPYTTLSDRSVCFRAGISLVPFCSIRDNGPVTELKCPAPDGAAWGVTPFRGRTVPVASSDLVGLFQPLVAQVPRSACTALVGVRR